MRRSNDSSFWLPKTLPNVHAELVSTVRVVSLSWHKMEQPAGGSTQGKRAERTEGSIRFGCTFTTVTVEGATTNDAGIDDDVPRPSLRAGGFDRPSRAHTPREGVHRAEDEDGRRAPRRRRSRRRRCVPAPFTRRHGKKGHSATSAERSYPRRDPPVLDLR